MQYILKDRKPIEEPDGMKWAEWFSNNTEDRIVAQTTLDKAQVSTVFLGLDHAFGGPKPVLFETMVFGGEHDQLMYRYHTWEEAEKGHEEAVNLVKGKEKDMS